jgi:hypothetical protein
VLLLMQLGVLQIPGLWRFWPAVFGVAAVSQLMERKPGSAAMSVPHGRRLLRRPVPLARALVRSFWPLLVVAVGVGIVLAAISGEDRHGAR